MVALIIVTLTLTLILTSPGADGRGDRRRPKGGAKNGPTLNLTVISTLKTLVSKVTVNDILALTLICTVIWGVSLLGVRVSGGAMDGPYLSPSPRL